MLKKGFIFVIGVILIYIMIMAMLKLVFYPTKYKNEVERAAENYSVDPYIIFSVIKQESNFKAHASSTKGASGLMQLLPATAKEVAISMNSIDESNFDIYDAETNIYIGVKYLSELIQRYDGNIYIAIAAYNAGMGNVDKWYEQPYSSYDTIDKVIEKIEYKETKTYVINIANYYNMYRKLY